MRHLAARLLAAIATVTLMLIVIASLIAFSIGYLLDSLVALLQPIIGHASALSVAGLSGLLLLFLLCLLLKRNLLSPDKTATQEQSRYVSQFEQSRELIQKYPLEAAALAFIGGIAAKHPQTRELMKSTVQSWLDESGAG